MPTSLLRNAALGALMLLTVAAAGCGGKGQLSTATSDALGVASITEASLDFGAASCGGEAPASKTITLKNDGEGPLRYAISLDSSAYFGLEGTRSGTLAEGESATVTVTAASMPASANAGEGKKANVVVTTDDPLHPEVYIPLSVAAQGATFQLVAPSLADFGEVPMGVPATPIPFVLRNVGNAPAKVSVAAPIDPQFSFTWTGGPGAAEVAPGAVMAGLTGHFTPSRTNPSTSAGLLEVEGAVCGASASTLASRGAGLGGIVGISPGVVDLGKVGCNTKAQDQVLTVYNAGNLVFTWAASLKDGSNYKLSQTGGAIIPGGAVQLTITPKALGMTTNLADNGFGDTVTVTTNIPGDMPHEVPIKQTAVGAILTWNATPLDFGTQAAFVASPGKFVVVTNTGTQAAIVKVAGTGQFTATEGAVPGGGGSFVSVVKYTPDDLGPQTGNFVLATDDAICQPLPEAVSAKGQGKGAASAIAMGGPGRRMYRNSQGGQSTCVILANAGGRVACFGQNNFLQLGTTASTAGPVVVSALKDIIGIASGGDFNCAIKKGGNVYCWGNNRNRNNARVGKIGSALLDQSEEPQLVGVTDATQIDADHNMACALLATGNVSCWGVNRRGNLGSGTSGAHNGGVQEVPGLTNVTRIAVGGGGGCALRNDNTVWCWGRYSRCNLGNGNCDGQTSPVQIATVNDGKDIMAMSAQARGAGGRCALRADGSVWCWGSTRQGALGNGSTCCTQSTPSPASGLSGVTDFDGYYSGGCALMGDKTIRCWGRNEFGEAGDGSTGTRPDPVMVQGINDAVDIAAGGRGACAIVTGGGVKCWGNYGAGSSSAPQSIKYF
ncbi:MAG: choice-of-anchor D domain-containing protein [Deltaproteobacteria bacterium]|nr:choice-of-anchor D domain-containing protein [Deltaproteobacteria bacterium]